uniref:Uncharacterized protein LOC117353437 isoform X2 n=1 Tax=Geotrypetes seraphini TaxID=260995 RepID=A0A6P8PTA3_GEOSA|nr:uncharacterized protein LOC117353437 isoform X2 [Geotrypetes seraphini]
MPRSVSPGNRNCVSNWGGTRQRDASKNGRKNSRKPHVSGTKQTSSGGEQLNNRDGTAAGSPNTNDSSSSDSECCSAKGSPGLMYVSGTGMPSLSLTLLVVTALLLKRLFLSDCKAFLCCRSSQFWNISGCRRAQTLRKMYQHKRLILILLTTLVLFGLFYFFWFKPFTTSDRMLVQKLQRHLRKMEYEKRLVERKNQLIERKLREIIRGVAALLNHQIVEMSEEEMVPQKDRC